MPYVLSKVTEREDFNKVIELELNAYKEPLNTLVECFRGPTLEETQERQWQWYQGTPGSQWIKVVCTGTGEVVGGAEWVVYQENPFAEPGSAMIAYWWPQGMNLRAIRPKGVFTYKMIENVLHTMANQVLGAFMGQRPVRMSRPHVCTELSSKVPSVLAAMKV